MKKSTLVMVAVLALSGALTVGCSESDTGVNPGAVGVASSEGATGNTTGNALSSSEALFRSYSSTSDDDDDADENNGMRRYRVTIMNMSQGQPMSPPVAATHAKGFTMFAVGKLASRGLEAIAENGDESLMFNRYNNSSQATGVVDVAMPLTRYGTTVGSFKHYASFEINAREDDRFSMAAMLICSNDGFTGLNSVKLPEHGKKVYYLKPYDAGTEDNTELSADIVDGCSALGAVALAGDPNGNENDAVDSSPHQRIRKHRGTQGNGDLDPNAHVIERKVGKVIIELISDGDDEHDEDDD